jgi:hypothetical protein
MDYNKIYKLASSFNKISQEVVTSDDARGILQSTINDNIDSIFNKLQSEGISLNDWQINVSVDTGRNVNISSAPGDYYLRQALESNNSKPLERMFGDRAPEIFKELKNTKLKFDQLLSLLSVKAKSKLSVVPSEQLPVNYSPLLNGVTL